MRRRLFDAIRKLEDLGWKPHVPLMVILNKIAENDPPNVIEDLFEAFR